MLQQKDKFINLNSKEAIPVKIVSDPAIAAKECVQGQLIPILILDTSERPDINELVRLHTFFTPGDVDHVWGNLRKDEKQVALILKFQRPVECTVVIEFNVAKQAILVDRILRVKALYIQPGKEGDGIKTTYDNPRILIELPDTGFVPIWEKIMTENFISFLRNEGFSRQQARSGAKNMIKEMRKLNDLRVE